MRAAGAAIFLVARLLVMGPEGTETLSEHKAHIMPGATGLIKESIRDPEFPATVHLYLTPSRSGSSDSEPAIDVAIRSELWSAAGSARAGVPPDERNHDQMSISGGSALVQIAVNSESRRRLVLSISAPAKAAPAILAPKPASNPVPVIFDVQLFRTQESLREPVSTQRLRTLEGRAVSWKNSWRRPVNAPGERLAYVNEGVTLTLKPLQVSDGWVSIEATVTAQVIQDEVSGARPRDISSTTSRTMTYGIPFELSLATGSIRKTDSDTDKGNEGSSPEMVLFSITVLGMNSR
jgi:hypothetical protein